MAKLRTRKHKVVLARSAGGDAGITVMLAILGVFMFLPMYYVVIQSLKPLDELWMFPPRFYVMKPTLSNYSDLFSLMDTSVVPFTRYIFNTVFTTVAGTFGNLFISSLAAYAMAKIKFPGGDGMFRLIRTSLMFHQTVTAVTSFILMSALQIIDTYWAIIIPAWGTTLGLYLMKQFMDTHVNDSVLESARLDGANDLVLFTHITLPLALPIVLYYFVGCFSGIYNEYLWASLIMDSNQTVTTIMHSSVANGEIKYGAAYAMYFLAAIPLIITTVISMKYFKSGEFAAGLKL